MKIIKDQDKFNIIRFIPLIIILGLFIFFTLNYGNISIEDILNFTPSSYILTAIIILFIYAAKSISMFIPLSILYISVATIFSNFWAIVINFMGLIVCMTIPYFIGRFSGTNLLNKLVSRYPKIGKIMEMGEGNEWISIFIIKMIGFIPNEPSSLVFGGLNIKYKTYITAAVSAKVPLMIATTLIGFNIDNPRSPEFRWSIIISIIIFIGIGIIYRKNKDRF